MSGPGAWRIRRGGAADADILVALELAAFGPASWGGRSVADGLSTARVHALFGSLGGDLRPTAFCLWRDLGDEAEILTIGVSPERQRRGGASAMLDALTDALRETGARAVFLEVNARNDAALSLYRRRGFYVIGRRSRYYASGDDAIVMRQDL